MSSFVRASKYRHGASSFFFFFFFYRVYERGDNGVMREGMMGCVRVRGEG